MQRSEHFYLGTAAAVGVATLLATPFDARAQGASAVGWKGRGLWTSSGGRLPWRQEGGKGMTLMVVHFQMRPDPLAH
jgi:hypothetical protein